MATGFEPQQAWPPANPAKRESEWMQPALPWTYNNDGQNRALTPSNAHLRSHKHGATEISAVLPYHPDCKPVQHEFNIDVEEDYDNSEQFTEYEKGWHAFKQFFKHALNPLKRSLKCAFKSAFNASNAHPPPMCL
jgi:hypothetical protein